MTCIVLLVVFALWLDRKVRRQEHELAGFSEALKRSRAHAEEQRKRLAERSDLDQIKDEFISTVSHELRTPLTSIRGALGLLSSGLLGNVDARAQNLLRIASSNTERLIRLINDILDLERMESGRATVNMRRCSIYDLAREAVDTMTALADSSSIRLELNSYAAHDAIYFDADPDRILQVLTNLLSNAIKFSPATSTVSVQIDASIEALSIKVIDRGRGIPPDKLESIFDRFQQVESSDSSKKGGTGLGLAICRSIIQQHGGMIWAQPNRDWARPEQTAPGTTFCVQFSRSVRASDNSMPMQTSPMSERGEGLILVCDDDPGIRTVVCEQLRRHGYDVIEAGSGEEVIALAHEQAMRNAPSAAISGILLDHYLPGLSGWETLHQLKSSPATAAIPVIVLSVSSPSERPLLVGEAQGWVQKPFNEGLLLGELARVLKSKAKAGSIAIKQNEPVASRLTV
ncbi:MAG TPA: ATP-binding protein [Acidobacteriaceae bacterium]|nr:ATP-binding protein [Acidobacteriaceae bacterium]